MLCSALGIPDAGVGDVGAGSCMRTCMWLDFLDHQTLYLEGGEVSTAEPEPKEDLAAEPGISVAITRARLIAHLGSCCRAWDRCRRTSGLAPDSAVVKVSRQWDESHHVGKTMSLSSQPTVNVEGCKELAQTGCVSRWESFKGQVSWTCWPEGACLHLRPGDVQGWSDQHQPF